VSRREDERDSAEQAFLDGLSEVGDIGGEILQRVDQNRVETGGEERVCNDRTEEKRAQRKENERR
jgi:hypothetical protein